MKKLISLIVLAAMLVACMIPAAFADEAVVLSASNKTAEIGDEVEITVALNKAAIASYGMEFDYDAEALELVKIVDAKVLGMFDCTPEEKVVGAINMENVEVDGALFTLVFKVTEKAALGTTYPITLILDSITDEDANEIAVTVANGSITVTHECVAGEWELVKAETCDEDGEKVQKCTLCGKVLATEVIPAHDHEMSEWVVTKAPTTEEEGEKTRACKHTDHCDYTETAAVAKLDPELPPVTGDITPYIAMTAMTVVALVAAAGYVVLKRKAV